MADEIPTVYVQTISTEVVPFPERKLEVFGRLNQAFYVAGDNVRSVTNRDVVSAVETRTTESMPIYGWEALDWGFQIDVPRELFY